MADKDNLIKIEKWLKEKKYISHLSSDSRNISEGDVFMAFKGKKFDGRDFIPNAINSGAKTILFDPIGNFRWDKAWEVDCLVCWNYWYKWKNFMFSLDCTGSFKKKYSICSNWKFRSRSIFFESKTKI